MNLYDALVVSASFAVITSTCTSIPPPAVSHPHAASTPPATFMTLARCDKGAPSKGAPKSPGSARRHTFTFPSAALRLGPVETGATWPVAVESMPGLLQALREPLRQHSNPTTATGAQRSMLRPPS